jgi:DNA-binding CsgD family transcriptional regulator
MYKLDSRSLELVLSALAELNSDADPATLSERAIRSAMKMVECDLLTFDLFSKNERYEDTAWSNAPDVLNPEFMRTFGDLLHQHPLVKIGLGNPNGEALKITDVITQAEFERTDLYNVLYRQVHVNKQLGLGLLSEGDMIMTCAFTRDGGDFTDREKAIATLAAPHFVNAIRNGFAFRRMSEALTAGGSGVVAIDAIGRLTFASSYARVLLEKYFPAQPLAPDSLPTTLSEWLRAAFLRMMPVDYGLPVEPFRIMDPHGSRLTVRLLDNRSNNEDLLLFEEARAATPDDFRPFGLTLRECEILYWVTEGKTDPDIALLLDVKLRTVQKHIENIYRKLGVESRTAALRTALDVIH